MDPLQFFEFQPSGPTLADIDTPVPLIDLDIALANITRWQAACSAAGLANRPHIKTHKLVPMARLQLALGASGITVQKLGEAEVMADAGITDLLLTFNVLGAAKLQRLAALMRRTAIRVVADNATVVQALSTTAAQGGRSLTVLVECDTGARRNGVATPQAACDLALLVNGTPGLHFGGLMTYPPPGGREATAAFLQAARTLCEAAGLAVQTVSSGGSPDMWQSAGLTPLTEYRAGTYVYGDRAMVASNTCTVADCALTVLATIVSVPAPDRAIIDAGSKSLTSDIPGLTGYGVVPALDMATVTALSEEHGILGIGHLATKPRVGDRVRIVPNHVCPVSNLFDDVVFVRGAQVLGRVPVDARGTVR